MARISSLNYISDESAGEGYEPPFPQDICIDCVSAGGGLLDRDYLGDLYWCESEVAPYYNRFDLRTMNPKQ